MKRGLIALAVAVLFCGAVIAADAPGTYIWLASGSSPTDSTVTLRVPTSKYFIYAGADSVSCTLYRGRYASGTWSYDSLYVVHIPAGTAINHEYGPLIKKIAINRPSSAPEVIFYETHETRY